MLPCSSSVVHLREALPHRLLKDSGWRKLNVSIHLPLYEPSCSRSVDSRELIWGRCQLVSGTAQQGQKATGLCVRFVLRNEIIWADRKIQGVEVVKSRFAPLGVPLKFEANTNKKRRKKKLWRLDAAPIMDHAMKSGLGG